VGEIEKTENTEQLDESQVSDPPSASAQVQAVGADASPAEPASLAAPVPAAVAAAVDDEEASLLEASPVEAPVPRSIIDGQEHAVDPRSVTAARIVTILPILAVAVGPFLGITIGWAFEGIPTVVYLPLLAGWFVLFGGALTFAYKWPELHHRHLRYRVDETGVRIRRGVWWRQVISIPTSRVQHTDVSQGPIQRSFELATLTVFTAGTEGASISLEGLEHGVARRLRDHLLPDHEADAV
jgi:membrane protein YdbS with pleckstrin-like domain